MSLRRSSPMKRDGAGARRFANAARKPLKRTEMKPAAGMKRKPLRAKSEKRAAQRPHEEAVIEAVYVRDGGCILRTYEGHVCGGKRQTPHHLQKQSAGGAWSLENVVCLCAAGNGAVEDDPPWARIVGLVVRWDIDHSEAFQRRKDAGLVARR
jgi:hypothetical protein